LCTPWRRHQFVLSRSKFLRFPRRSHRCEFWEFCSVYLQTELIYPWRTLNFKIESQRKSAITTLAGYLTSEDLTADRIFTLANPSKLQR
jgi:hypothetical protein